MFENDNPDTALYFYNKSLKLAESKKIKKMEAASLYNIGLVNYSRYQNSKALEYYLKSLKIDKELDNKRGISETYNCIGIANYAKRIQQAMLPSGKYAHNILGNHFIFFKPKDIVSGDFYRTAKIYNGTCPIVVIAVADCTRHGVPGVFMNMLGVSFLNEIVRRKKIKKASEVLDYSRESIIEALQQKGQSGEQKDGMDISLLVINTETNECQWAGANNPLYVIAKEGLTEAISLTTQSDCFVPKKNRDSQ